MSKDKLGINPKDYKYVKSDADTTTLQHRKGHIVTIAHKVLSKPNQEMLKALSGSAKQYQTEDQRQEAGNKYGQMKAKGGEVNKHKLEVKGHKYHVQGSGGQGYRLHHQDPKGETRTIGPFQSPDHAISYAKSQHMETDKYAEGGETKVRAPAQRDEELPKSKEEHRIPANVNGPKSISEAMDRLRNAFAEGGHVAVHKMLFADGGYAAEDAALDREVNSNENFAKQLNGQDIGNVQGAMSQSPKAPTQDQQFFNETFDKSKQVETALNPIRKMLGMQEVNPDIRASQGALQRLKVDQEKRSEQQGAAQQTEAQINQINLERQQLGLPPIPGTMAPSTVPELGVSQQQPSAISQNPNAQMMSNPAQQPQAQAAASTGHTGIGNYEGLLSQGLEMERAGATNKAKAVGELGQQQANILTEQNQAMQQSQKAYKMAYDQLENERQSHMQDIRDGYIDPNAYWKDHSKIASGIGMILAGFNPTNNPNAAMNFLRFQMEQSLDAQKQNLGAKNNLLASNLQQFGNLKNAQDMTRIMMADQLKAQIEAAAARAASPMAKAEAMKAVGEIDSKYAPLALQLSMRQALMGLATHGGSPQAVEQTMQYMDVMNPGSSKGYRERYMPGYTGNSGPFAAIEIPDKIRQELSAKDTLDMTAKELLDWSKNHTTVLPGTREYNVGQQKALVLQSMVREAMLNTVYREGEQPLLDKVVKSNPAGLLKELNSIPKLQELIRYNDATRIQTAKHYGLKPQSMQQTQDGQEQVSKSGKPMIFKNGQWHYK